MKTTFTNTAEIKLHDLGYLEIRLLDTEAPFDLEEAKKQFETALELSGGVPYLVLVDTEGSSVQPTKEAQEFLMDSKFRIAEAVIVKSLPMRILARFYVRGINSHPVKIFKYREKALEWLLSFKGE